MSETSTITIILQLHSLYLTCWVMGEKQPPKQQRVQGDLRIRINGVNWAQRQHFLQDACKDLAERLKDASDASVQRVCWLVDDESRPLLLEHLCKSGPLLPGYEGMGWQVFDWQWLSAYLGLHEQDICAPHQPYDSQNAPDKTAMSEHVLPWLRYVYFSKLTPGQLSNAQAAADVHKQDETLQQLGGQIMALKSENNQLRSQLQHIQKVDAERLMTYLPAIFQKPFTVLGATDLALLTGHITPLPIPNPYPEPSSETLHRLQHNFRSLPRAQQMEIIALVRDLPQRQKLQPQPQMRELVEQLEGARL